MDRAAHWRADPAHIEDLWNSEKAQVVVLWQGKLLSRLDGSALLRVPASHPVLQDAGNVTLFLGLDENGPVFAVSLDGWEPGEEVDPTSFLDPTVQHHPAIKDDAGFKELRSMMTGLSPRDAELAATSRAVLGWHESHRFCSRCGDESAPAQAGWQRVCPTCGGGHFPRTDPVVIMLITQGDDLLIGRSPGWPEGMYSLLAGFIEPGETMEAAVRREVHEESGILVGEVGYLASQPWAFPSSLMFGCRGEALSRDITLDPLELEDARWISRDEMKTVMAGQHPTILPARNGAIAHFLVVNWLADTLD